MSRIPRPVLALGAAVLIVLPGRSYRLWRSLIDAYLR